MVQGTSNGTRVLVPGRLTQKPEDDHARCDLRVAVSPDARCDADRVHVKGLADSQSSGAQ